jgi:hypothetical protein
MLTGSWVRSISTHLVRSTATPGGLHDIISCLSTTIASLYPHNGYVGGWEGHGDLAPLLWICRGLGGFSCRAFKRLGKGRLVFHLDANHVRYFRRRWRLLYIYLIIFVVFSWMGSKFGAFNCYRSKLPSDRGFTWILQLAKVWIKTCSTRDGRRVTYYLLSSDTFTK